MHLDCVCVCDRVYRESEAMKMKQMKATYGDRIGCGIKKNLETDDDDKLLVYFKKNGAVVSGNLQRQFMAFYESWK